MAVIHVSEIQPGLVLHLDPAVLISAGASVTDATGNPLQPDRTVLGGHFFVCLAVDARHSQWLPTFTNAAIGNLEIPHGRKTGHPAWTEKPTHFNPHQKWAVAVTAIPNAARAGKDASHMGSRNGVDVYLIADLIAGLSRASKIALALTGRPRDPACA